MSTKYDSYTEELWQLALQAKHVRSANSQMSTDEASGAIKKFNDMAIEFANKYSVESGFVKKLAFHVAETCDAL
jgi:hypothetical protein